MRLTSLSAALLILATGATRAAEGPSRLIVPAYGNPCCTPGQQLWQGLIQAARPGVLDVILNPNSGPGTSPIDPNYIRPEDRTGPLFDLSRAGASIYGYVHTSWGRRALEQVLGEIDRYFDHTYYRAAELPLAGIFIDEVANDLAKVPYYATIAQHVRSEYPGARILGNPGTSFMTDSSRGTAGFTLDDYVQLFDQIVTFEDSGNSYRRAYAAPAWTARYPSQRFAHIVHSEAGLETMLLDVQLAAQRNVSTLFITDDVLPNPYDRLPSYWIELLAAVVPPVSIDELTRAIQSGSANHHYDLNQDGLVNPADRQFWIESVASTVYGDANLDRRFDAQDLVAVFQVGEYEDEVAMNSRWSSGDWDGDGDFTSSDLILAFRTGMYGPPVLAVPEPVGLQPMAWFGALTLMALRPLHPVARRHHRPCAGGTMTDGYDECTRQRLVTTGPVPVGR